MTATPNLYNIYLAQTALFGAMERAGVKPFITFTTRPDVSEYGQTEAIRLIEDESQVPPYIGGVYGKLNLMTGLEDAHSYGSEITAKRQSDMAAVLDELPGLHRVLLYEERTIIVGMIHNVTYEIDCGVTSIEHAQYAGSGETRDPSEIS